MEIFDDEFLASLPDNGVDRCYALIQRINHCITDYSDENSRLIFGDSESIEFIEALFLLAEECKSADIKIPNINLKSPADLHYGYIHTNIDSAQGPIINTWRLRHIQIAKNKAEKTFEKISGKLFQYHFPQSQIDEIQNCLDGLRKLISESSELEKFHRERLIKRIEQLQTELHKKHSNLDLFWGFFCDVQVTAQQIYSDPQKRKDTIELVTQFGKILMAAQSIAHALPASHEHLSLPSPPTNEHHSSINIIH